MNKFERTRQAIDEMENDELMDLYNAFYKDINETTKDAVFYMSSIIELHNDSIKALLDNIEGGCFDLFDEYFMQYYDGVITSSNSVWELIEGDLDDLTEWVIRKKMEVI